MYDIEIPKVIRVGGFDYDILCNEDRDKDLENRNRWGEISSYFKTITLRSKASPQQFSENFIHEALVHAVDHIYLGDSLSENQTTVFSHGLHQVLEELGVRFVMKRKI